MSSLGLIFIILLLAVLALLYYLFKPFKNPPVPAKIHCLDMEEGHYVSRDSLPLPQHVYGMGLTFSEHIKETSADYDPTAFPAIFKKDLKSLNIVDGKVAVPTKEVLLEAIRSLDPGAAEKLSAEYANLSPLFDYEVELAFVLLEDISPEDLGKEGFAPKLGYLLANDLSARSIGILGEGQPNRYDFWGVSKSFEGFLPLGDQVWIPNVEDGKAMPCVKLETRVNGELRQSEDIRQLIYTPIEMLRFIHEKFKTPFKKGDMVLTGTPGGVVLSTPRPLVRASELLGFDRYKKLSVKLRDEKKFLQAGDRVEISALGLGKVVSEIVAAE